jgi:hypothetical protein
MKYLVLLKEKPTKTIIEEIVRLGLKLDRSLEFVKVLVGEISPENISAIESHPIVKMVAASGEFRALDWPIQIKEG